MTTIEELAREGHGAIEVADSPDVKPLMVFLAGPISFWWKDDNFNSEQHQEYAEFRDAIRVACVKAGYLVYSPHRAWQGAWNEEAQEVNNAAIKASDVMIVMYPRGYVEMPGTVAEIAYAKSVLTDIRYVDIEYVTAIDGLIADLEITKKIVWRPGT